jgi:hypothetical protein
VDSPQAAVKAAIMSEIKGAREKEKGWSPKIRKG